MMASATLRLIFGARRAITFGTDRGYDVADFVEECRTLNVRPQVAQIRLPKLLTLPA